MLGIIRGHKSAIRLYSKLGKGTTFKVLFPVKDQAENDVASRRESEAIADDWRGTGTVLIADDEEMVCAVGKQMLERLVFSALTAKDGRDAVEVFRKNADEIVCVLLDLTMPHLDGQQSFREIRRIRAGAPVILCSGYNEQDATQRFVGKGLTRFIQKPYDLATLKGKLREIVGD